MASNIVLCKVCNKPIKSIGALKNTCGATCAKMLANGNTSATLPISQKAYSVASVPVGFVNMQTIHNSIVASVQTPISVNRFVQATGGDRPYRKGAVFMHAILKPLLVHGSNTRWFNPWCNTLACWQAIATNNFTNAPKVK